ncbi:MAG: hypothetical protein AAGD13_19410 [Pseudomonadota bacterium]
MAAILIAQPTTGHVVSGTVSYLMDLTVALHRRGIPYSYRQLALSDIALSRNILASLVRADASCSHLLFIDSDMGFLADSILGLLDFDQPVTAIACPKRHLAWDRLRSAAESEALAGRTGDDRRTTSTLMDLCLEFNVDLKRFDGSDWAAERRGNFLKVPAVGTGIMLIRRDVLEAMVERKVATRRTGYTGLPLLGDAPFYDFFSPVETPDRSLIESEDISFCKRWVEDCDGEIWVDIASRVLHYGMRGHSGRYLPRAFLDFPEISQ